MAEPTQFSFSWQEVAEILIKKQNIHEGKWMIGLEISVTIGNMGLKPPNPVPGALMQANGLVLSKAAADAPANLVVDASVVNPKD